MNDTYKQRAYAGAADFISLCAFASATTRACLPGRARWHPGDFAWMLGVAGHEAPQPHVQCCWQQNAGAAPELVGVTVWSGAAEVQFACMPAVEAALAPQLLDAAWRTYARRRERHGSAVPDALRVLSFASAVGRTQLLEQAGFVREKPAGVYLMRQLHEVPLVPELGTGLRFVDGAAYDASRRAAAHRDAWNHLAHIGLPDARSEFDLARLMRVRACSNYTHALDLVVEHEASGAYVSSALCWLDAYSGVGLTEPVGTHVAWRQRGLSRAANMEGMRRLHAHGMHTAVIQTARINLPAQATYRGCGYVQVDEDIVFARSR